MTYLRQLGEKMLVEAWHFLCDLLEVILMSYKFTLNKRNRYSSRPLKKSVLKNRLICSVISTVCTAIIFIRIITGSFISTGFAYGIASIMKHFAIILASDKGDWSHWMTGGVYTFFRDYKEALIEHDAFAQFLNALAGNGFLLKAIQILLILFCIAVVVAIAELFITCLSVLYADIRLLVERKRAEMQYRAH